jgi:pimeloyl-ACP methyl ester carboxylesterase
MTPDERTVRVNGLPCRVWEAGTGERLGYLGGLGGVLRWSPFLELLSRRRRVIVPSLPGFPGALGHDRLDDIADWVAAALDLLEESGLEGADLIGASVGGMLAAEIAAFSRAAVRRLVLVAPFGLFDVGDPVADVFAQKPKDLPALLCVRPERLAEEQSPPQEEDPAEWMIMLARAGEAAARILWSLGDHGLAKRLHRIRVPTLVLWGTADRVIPPSYARRFAAGIGGAVEVATIEGAGHFADLDAPDEVATAIERFLAKGEDR